MKNWMNFIVDYNITYCKCESNQSAMDLYRKIENL
jgi:hypothetical protein